VASTGVIERYGATVLLDIRIIAEALGHETLESTRIYTQVSFERVRQIAELLDLPGGLIIRGNNGNRATGSARA
jgi:hypothetical protein